MQTDIFKSGVLEEVLSSLRKECDKCKGKGWVGGFQLDHADIDTYNDTVTKYSCDGDVYTYKRTSRVL